MFHSFYMIFFVWLGNWTRFVMTIGKFMFVINETKRGFYNIEIIFILYYLHISNYEFEFIFGFNEINKHWLIIIMKFWVRINFIISKSCWIPGILRLAIWIKNTIQMKSKLHWFPGNCISKIHYSPEEPLSILHKPGHF